MLGDIILAEPKALIGFAGPRVIEQTIGQKLPEGFQSSEFLLEHGFIDKIVERQNMKETLAKILNIHEKKEDAVSSLAESVGENGWSRVARAEENLGKSPWDTVLLSRRSDGRLPWTISTGCLTILQSFMGIGILRMTERL